VDCKEFQENVSAAVDRYLKSEEMRAFTEHASRCPSCQYEYEIESVTKSVVSSKAKFLPTPAGVLEGIVERINHEQASVLAFWRSWVRYFLQRPLVKPAIALCVAAAAVIVILTSGTHQSDVEFATDDVIQQSLINYRAVVNGDIKPQLVSREPESLKNFFSGKTDFPVFFPAMKSCSLVGGGLNDHSGTTLAHVMYTHNNDLIFVYQACWQTVMKGERLKLPQQAKDELEHTGWFAETRPDGSTIVLWTRGRTLCAAVAHMSKEDLIACLTEGETADPTGW
jgi:hypothetical protein